MTALQFVQACYVVNDLAASCERWHRLFGLGPFLGGGSFTLDNHIYRGHAAGPIEARGVFVQSGEMVVELLELRSSGPDAFHDMFAPGAEGLHHMAVFCDDYEAQRDALNAAGYPIASEFKMNFGAQICYVDTRAACGHMLELYPENAVIRGMYRQTRAAAAAWDRKSLILPWVF